MNTLVEFITKHGLDPVQTVNHLLAFGLISDNVITPADVAEPDATRAVDFLKENIWIKHP